MYSPMPAASVHLCVMLTSHLVPDTHSPTHPPTHSPIHPPTHPPLQVLKVKGNPLAEVPYLVAVLAAHVDQLDVEGSALQEEPGLGRRTRGAVSRAAGSSGSAAAAWKASSAAAVAAAEAGAQQLAAAAAAAGAQVAAGEGQL
jgi:hypothetical protein